MQGRRASLGADVQSACGKSDSRRVNEKQTLSTGSCSAKKFCAVRGLLWCPIKTCYNLATLSATLGKGNVAAELSTPWKKNRCCVTLVM